MDWTAKFRRTPLYSHLSGVQAFDQVFSSSQKSTGVRLQYIQGDSVVTGLYLDLPLPLVFVLDTSIFQLYKLCLKEFFFFGGLNWLKKKLTLTWFGLEYIDRSS